MTLSEHIQYHYRGNPLKVETETCFKNMKGIIGNITFPFLFQTVESNKQKTFFSIFLAVFFNSCYTSRTSIFSSFSLFMPPDMETSFKSKTKHVP